jgi:hypothetical protein
MKPKNNHFEKPEILHRPSGFADLSFQQVEGQSRLPEA